MSKTALITGANSFVGSAIGQGLAEAGFNLVQSSSGSDKFCTPSFLEPLNISIPCDSVLAWVLGVVTVIGTILAAITVFIGNVQKLLDFIKKNLIPAKSELSDSEIRKRLLFQLNEDYSGRLRDSLHNLVKIDLQIEEQLERVGRSTPELIPEDSPQPNFLNLNRVFRLFKTRDDSRTQLEPNQKTVEFYDRKDIGGKLLILGEPGAGKTTELLSLADDLLQKAKEDENAPVPVILELSAWKVNQPLSEWLIAQLFAIYHLSKTRGKRWLESSRFIFLLDGLDELGLVNQAKCTEAINQFLRETFQPGLVVCCRREEFEKAQVPLEELKGAIYLQKLTDNQIYQYLKDLKRSRLLDHSQFGSELLELARSPLFLSMLAIAYQGNAINNYQQLFDAYIKKQIRDPKYKQTYPPGKSPSQEKTLHYLVWLARKLEEEGATEFLIEQMQPTALESPKEKVFYRMSSGLAGGLLAGLALWLWFGPSFGLMYGLWAGLVSLVLGPLLGLVSLWYRPIGVQNGIKPAENLAFSFKKFLSQGLMYGLSAGLLTGLSAGLIYGGLMYGLFWGLLAGLLTGLLAGLRAGLIKSEIPIRKKVNEGIWLSFRNGLVVMLGGGLFFGLVIGLMSGLLFGLDGGVFLGLLFGLCVGLPGGLWAGLESVIDHFALRFVLHRNGYIPWNYARFLDHAAKHRFMQRVGGRYRFMHDLLRKHFATMSLDEHDLKQFLNS
ncbi:MAG: NACHT domain-containing protein [Crocosphaera sp.]|nr:NACHT domain-containing protein [Crocosphaera sp.]